MKRPPSTKRPRDFVFFTDRDLGHIIPDRLEAASVHVERHDQHFGPTTPDVQWLREVGKRGWIAFTHNKGIWYNTAERDMVMRAGVALFMLIRRHSHPVLARNLVQTLPRILSFIRSHTPPYIARVYKAPEKQFKKGKPGRVTLWLSYERWHEGAEK